MIDGQAWTSSYAPRLRQYGNAFLAPVLQTQAIPGAARTTKRGTAIKNYADDIDDDEFDDDSESQRRPTGLRTLRMQDVEKKETQHDRLGRELRGPIALQGIYRDWMVRRPVKPTYAEHELYHPHNAYQCYYSTSLQVNVQAQLPLTLIPIRVDINIPMYTPSTAFPIPDKLEPALTLEPPFRRPETLPGYKLRDNFLWNLHETLTTPEDFALNLVRDLDLPNQAGIAMAIADQIRDQLVDYAGVALHPLFHTQPKPKANEQSTNDLTNGNQAASPSSRDGTPRPSTAFGATPRGISATPNPSTPAASTPYAYTLPNGGTVTSHASPAPLQRDTDEDSPHNQYLNPDDMYRCIITLSISLSSKLYTDKFEWSLLHPPGAAEAFAAQTCADMNLTGEWVSAITHAIYEAVLRLKKEACEGGMILTSAGIPGIWAQGDVDNQAVNPETGAGWRYDVDDFGAEWQPSLEELNKEEIEKREGDRERQLRRVRRETAKFSSTSGMAPTQREREAEIRGSYFDTFSFVPQQQIVTLAGTASISTPGGAVGAGDETPSMGRGERSKKKRRFRSLSPVARAIGNAAAAGTPDPGLGSIGVGWGGETSKPSEYEKQQWRCIWCQVWGNSAWALRDGPNGGRVCLLSC